MQLLSWLYTKITQVTQPQCFGNGGMPGQARPSFFNDTEMPVAIVKAEQEEKGVWGRPPNKLLRPRPLERR